MNQSVGNAIYRRFADEIIPRINNATNAQFSFANYFPLVMACQTQLVSCIAPPQSASMRDFNDSFDIQTTLLLAAIESFTVGLVIVAQNGTILHRNRRAQALLEAMPWTSPQTVPETLWHSCQTLLENQEEQSDLWPVGYTIVLEDEISTNHGTIHMKAQWFDWDASPSQTSDCFLITLENRQESLTALAQQEAQRYGLTTRETDVWCLKRMGHSYKKIAATLYISENTVKKHLKNIYSKQQESSWSI